MAIAVVVGLRDTRSIAYGIGVQLAHQGITVIYGYQPRNKGSALPAASGTVAFPLEITDPISVENFVKQVTSLGKIDYLVHSVAFARKEHLRASFFDVDLAGWNLAMQVSTYSFLDMVRRFAQYMHTNGSILTLSYRGSHEAVQGYHLMGACKAALESTAVYLAKELPHLRINCLVAPPVDTSAARAIEGFDALRDKGFVSNMDIGERAVEILLHEKESGKIIKWERITDSKNG